MDHYLIRTNIFFGASIVYKPFIPTGLKLSNLGIIPVEADYDNVPIGIVVPQPVKHPDHFAHDLVRVQSQQRNTWYRQANKIENRF